MKQWLKDNSSLFLIIAVILIAGYVFLSCKSFEPVIVEGQPPECNDFYTSMKYYSVQGKGDSAFVGTVYTECKTARSDIRKQSREKHCKDLIYGTDPLNKTDYKRYSEFQECSK